MAEFSFTMSDGSVMSWDAPDPETTVFGREEFEHTTCEADDILVVAIDKLLNREYTSGK